MWRSDASALLQEETRSAAAGTRRLTTGLIAAQVACSLLLVVGAVSMARTLGNLRRVPVGFDTDRLLLVEVNAGGLAAPDQMSRYHTLLHERIAAVPGVARATMAQLGILTSAATIMTVDVAGYVPQSDEDRIARVFFVGPGYFETIGMPLVAGVSLDTLSSGDSRVAVVNERFAKIHFGAADKAIGQIFNQDVRIVGVAADAHYSTLRDEPVARTVFVPFAALQRPAMTHVVRFAADDARTTAAVREAVSAHDSRLRPRFFTADEVITAALARERFFAAIAVVLAGLAVTLAAAGLYAAVTYSISQRRGELAVRLALGASARSLVALVLRGPLSTTMIGVAIGLPAAYVAMRSTASLLFGVAPFDVLTIGGAAAGLVTVGILAAIWPACRAARIDLATALRR